MPQLNQKQLNVLQAHWSTYTYTVVDGAGSTVLPGGFVTASVTQVSGGDPNTLTRGIITSAPYNFVKLRNSNTALTLDNSGSQVYGRITYSSPNFTVTYYKLVAGVETATTVPVSGSGTYSVDLIYPEVMKFEEVPASSNIVFGQNSELVTTGSSISGDLTVSGNTTLGDSSSDTVTFNARLASNLSPTADNLRNLGTSALRLADINSVQFTARGDITDSIKSIYNSTSISYSGTPFAIDGSNILNLGIASATEVNIGRSGANLTVDSSLTTFNGNISVAGTISYLNLSIAGSTTLGDDPSDLITLNAKFNSDLLPSVTDTYSVGNSSYRFLDGYFKTIHVEDGYITNIDLSGSFYELSPAALGSATPGVSLLFAHGDHAHEHGNLSGGSLHSLATTSVSGFMSATDKTNHDSLFLNFGSLSTSSSAIADTLALRDSSANIEFKRIDFKDTTSPGTPAGESWVWSESGILNFSTPSGVIQFDGESIGWTGVGSLVLESFDSPSTSGNITLSPTASSVSIAGDLLTFLSKTGSFSVALVNAAATTLTYQNTVTSVTESIAQAAAGAGGQRYIEPGLGASGSANGKLHLGLRNGNTVNGGEINIGLGSTVAGVSDKLTIGTGTPGSLTDILRIYSPAASYTRIGESTGSAANLQMFCSASMDLTSGTTLSFNGPTSVTQRSTQHIYADSSTQYPLTYTPAAAATWTFGASLSSIAMGQTQDASAAGANWTIRAQQGFAGFAGGDLILGGGDGGTTGTNAPGNTRVKVGTAVSNVSGIFRIEDEAGTAIFDLWQSSASLSRISAGFRALRIGNLTESEVYIGGSGVTTITSNANVIQLGGTGIQLAAANALWASPITAAKLGQSQASAGAGSPLTVEAQQGAAGSAGGNLTLLAGKGGTPGTNSAGKIVLDVGATVSGVSSAIQSQADTVVYASELFGTATITSATTTSIVTFTTTSNRVYTIEARFTVSNDTDDEGASFTLSASFKNVAGTVTQIGTAALITGFADANQSGLSANIDFSGTAIRARLTTDSADTVNANGALKIYERVLA